MSSSKQQALNLLPTTNLPSSEKFLFLIEVICAFIAAKNDLLAVFYS